MGIRRNVVEVWEKHYLLTHLSQSHTHCTLFSWVPKSSHVFAASDFVLVNDD